MDTQTNAKARPTASQLDSVDKAVELTFPASDPIAVTPRRRKPPAAPRVDARNA